MKISEYKGYEIQFDDFSGYFTIEDITGQFDNYKDATAKIDRVIKAEDKGHFPIDAITNSMKVGKLTSYNREEKSAWFSPDLGSRSKDRIVDYAGRPRFYKATEANLQLAMRYREIEEFSRKLIQEQRQLETKLTDPITFEANQ